VKTPQPKKFEPNRGASLEASTSVSNPEEQRSGYYDVADRSGPPTRLELDATPIPGADDPQRSQREMLSRKMEAVGQLAAGIAHEINTPMQYVGDNIHFLAESFATLEVLITKYRQGIAALADAPGHSLVAEAMKDAEEVADLTYIEQSAPRAFEQAAEGVSRVSAIVSAMKEFAHPDGREKSPDDLNRALQATLTIARNEYKYVADIETQFGEIPPILCHIGDISQVLLNLIVNAAHAISDRVGKTGGKGQIRVRTVREGDVARIDIADTGCGIPEAIRERIFDPFFTTKEVGRGTGQGLAIARSIIVDKHGGSLELESEVGQGTTFTIRLPLDGRGSERAIESVPDAKSVGSLAPAGSNLTHRD
jgi:two-component system, NtrC family, sensor kinase